MINKKLFFSFLGIIILSMGFYSFKKYGPQRLYDTSVGIEVFCDELFSQNSFFVAEEIIKTDCNNACSKIKMDFKEYDCPVGKNLFCDCR